MKKTAILTFAAAALLTALPACKPTEKAYRMAYEIAQAKKAADASDPDMPDMPVMQAEGEPKPTEIDGATMQMRTQPLKAYAEGPDPMPYNVAVGRYKMSTNAKSQAADLKGEGYDAYVLEDAHHQYYSIVGGYTELSDAVAAVKAYMKRYPKTVYPGLPSQPTIEMPSGRR